MTTGAREERGAAAREDRAVAVPSVVRRAVVHRTVARRVVAMVATAVK